jgi:hypothetical protein
MHGETVKLETEYLCYTMRLFSAWFPKTWPRFKKVSLPEGRTGNDWVILEQ